MNKKILISSILACLLCGSSLISANIFAVQHDSVEVQAAAHQDNFDPYTYSGTYYDGIDLAKATNGLNGTLRSSLSTLTKPKSVYAYSGGLAKELQGADADPTNSANMIYYYTRDSVKKNGASSWNREHVWPQSLSNNCWGTSNAGADLLHIRPTYNNTNSSRGNLKYGNMNKSNPQVYNGITYGYKGSYFEPIDSVKGDSARDVMYVWVAWYNQYGTSLPSITNVFQSFDVLMQWHISDKPDVLEGNRNNYSQNSNQKNRNPFVDHPEFAWKIFGEKCSASVLQAAKEAYPAEEIKVTGVNISETAKTINVSEKLQLTATVLPSDATNKNVTWSSSDSKVATVSATGLVTGKTKGKTTITVKTNDGGFTKTCNVEVIDTATHVTSVTLADEACTLTIGSSKKLAYTISPSDATVQTVTWKSSVPTVASVDEKGIVTALAEGTTNITIITDDGEFKDSCTITCEKGVVHVTGVSLSTTEINMKVDDSRIIVATVEPSTADNKKIIWSNSNPEVVSNTNGLIKGLKEGSAVVSVTTEDGGFIADCEIEVTNGNKPVTGVTLSSKTLNLFVGNKAKLTATITPTGAKDQSVAWSSSDSNIVSIDGNGNVVAIKEGTATITVKTNDGGFTDTCTITVSSKGQKGDPTSKGCSSSTIASSLIIAISAITGICGCLLKRRKER